MSNARYQELARQQKKSEGVLTIASLPRLQEALSELGVTDDQALAKVSVVYQLQGLPPRYFGDAQLPMLGLAVQTNLPLICQRCFAPMPQFLDVQFEFAVCDEPPEALLEDEDVDWLESSAESAFESLVEDELLMALPIAVMHEETCAPLQKTAGEKPNPFAALKNLKLDK
ncbi:YceD family protein [Methylophilus flavus]|uniref:Large ribosomal RNA subunit accumulation protein YceD n=1 Tax=Methylophilus flavus TaxID=640084 RepID=A0ABW3P4Q8_9PROT